MKDEYKNVLPGIIGHLVYSDTFKISDSEKEEMMNLDNWEFKSSNSALIILNEMLYLYEYKLFFVQIQLTVKNKAITRIDTITNEANKITL